MNYARGTAVDARTASHGWKATADAVRALTEWYALCGDQAVCSAVAWEALAASPITATESAKWAAAWDNRAVRLAVAWHATPSMPPRCWRRRRVYALPRPNG